MNVFFVASGFLVGRSLLVRGDLKGFVAARVLRIYPALIVLAFHTAFVPVEQGGNRNFFWPAPGRCASMEVRTLDDVHRLAESIGFK